MMPVPRLGSYRPDRTMRQPHDGATTDLRVRNDHEDLLRRLALSDDGAVTAILTRGRADLTGLDPKTLALVRLAGFIAVSSAPASFEWSVAAAIAAGADDDEVVAVLASMAPIVGAARVVAAAPDLARSLGYELDAAFENAGTEPSPRTRDQAGEAGP
jgi:alkylhydroperoxidase/carboxymuconolactone decarboxylase family protein YurZ